MLAACSCRLSACVAGGRSTGREGAPPPAAGVDLTDVFGMRSAGSCWLLRQVAHSAGDERVAVEEVCIVGNAQR